MKFTLIVARTEDLHLQGMKLANNPYGYPQEWMDRQLKSQKNWMKCHHTFYIELDANDIRGTELEAVFANHSTRTLWGYLDIPAPAEKNNWYSDVDISAEGSLRFLEDDNLLSNFNWEENPNSSYYLDGYSDNNVSLALWSLEYWKKQKEKRELNNELYRLTKDLKKFTEKSEKWQDLPLPVSLHPKNDDLDDYDSFDDDTWDMSCYNPDSGRY